MADKPFDIAGKDWLTVDEAAHYCGVSLRQFNEHANDYGLQARNFMGRKLYAKADLYQAIYGARLWQSSASPANGRPSTGAISTRNSASLSERLRPVRLRPYKPRKKAPEP